MAVRFCGNCEKIRTVDSTTTMQPPAGQAAQGAYDILCKRYSIEDVDAGMRHMIGFSEKQSHQIKRLTDVAKRLCPKADMIAIDFTCEECLTRAMQDMPINKIGVVIKEHYEAACFSAFPQKSEETK